MTGPCAIFEGGKDTALRDHDRDSVIKRRDELERVQRGG